MSVATQTPTRKGVRRAVASLKPSPSLFQELAQAAVAGALLGGLQLTATDLFCGAGGTTTGFENARWNELKIVNTRQVVNHDPLAIASHAANHSSARHYIEDITQLDANTLLRTAILWASLECTNFSNAKGGQSRDADSRSLAEHMERYIRAINPLYFFVENVKEFMSWGPLYHKKDKAGNPLYRRVKVMACRLSKQCKPIISRKGKPQTFQVRDEHGEKMWRDEPVMVPESRTKGKDFVRWMQSIEDLGYTCSYRMLNAADYGERTSRVRLFMIFAKKGLPIRWPQATHSKEGKTVGTEPWLPVRPVLRLEEKGRSIFNRMRLTKTGEWVPDPLVEKTLKRIYAGLCKYVAGEKPEVITAWLNSLIDLEGGVTPNRAARRAAERAQEAWLMKRSSNPPSGKPNAGASLDAPAPTVACGYHPDLVQTEFLAKAFTGQPEHLVQGTDKPAGSITTVDHHQLVQPVAWLDKRGSNPPSGKPNPGVPVDGVAPTLATCFQPSLIQPQFLTQYNGGSDECRNLSLEGPANTITTENRFGLVNVEFLCGQYGKHHNTSAAAPCPPLLATPKQNLVQVSFLDKNYGSGEHNHQPLEVPAGALSTKEHYALVQGEFLFSNYTGNDNTRPFSTDRPARTITCANGGQQYLVQVELNPAFLMQSNGGSPAAKVTSADQPARTVLASPNQAVVQAEFLFNPAWGGTTASVEEPGRTIVARQDKVPFSLVQTEFVAKYYGSGDNITSTAEPAGTLTTKDRMGLIQLRWVDKAYGSGAHNHQSLEGPAGTITTNDHHRLVEAEPWILRTDFDNVGRSIDEPAPTITADRHYPYIMHPEPWLLDNKFNNVGRDLQQPGPTLLTGDHHYLVAPFAGPEPEHWAEQPDDCETLRLIRRFMKAFGLSDVLMRMLLVPELLAIQGFPADYVLMGSSTDQKKFIGNSVPPKMSQRITEAIYGALVEFDLLDLLLPYQDDTLMAAA